MLRMGATLHWLDQKAQNSTATITLQIQLHPIHGYLHLPERWPHRHYRHCRWPLEQWLKAR